MQKDLKEAIELLAEGTYEPGCWLPTRWRERQDALIRKHQDLLGSIYEVG